MKVRWNLTKFFGLITGTLVFIYFVAQWYVTENPGAIWIVPEIYIIIGAIITGILTLVAYLRKV